MSWDDIMRRVLPPIDGVEPHITGPAGRFGAGKAEGRQPPSKIPHPGADFNYFGGQTGRLNQSHPALHSPVDGVVENAGQGTVGRIAIRDKNGFLHEILHSATRHVAIGDPVAAGQIIGTMGNTGVRDQHVHYQLRDPVGNVVNPTEFFDRQGPIDPNPASPLFLDQSQRAAEIIPSLDKKSSRNGGSPPDRPGDRFFNPFDQAPVAGFVPLPNAPVASDDPAFFADRYGNWAAKPGLDNNNISAPAPQAPNPGKRSETDDTPVRILSRVNPSPASASSDAPTLAPPPAPPLLGIFSGKPMPNWPVRPSIFVTDDRSDPDDDELVQRWRQWLDA